MRVCRLEYVRALRGEGIFAERPGSGVLREESAQLPRQILPRVAGAGLQAGGFGKTVYESLFAKFRNHDLSIQYMEIYPSIYIYI